MKMLSTSLATALLITSVAHAETVTQTFEGIVLRPPSDLAAEFPRGSRWTLEVEWDDEDDPTEIDSERAGYSLSNLTLTIEGVAGPFTASSTAGSFGMLKQSGYHEVQFTSGWGPEDHDNATIGDYDVYSINLTLGDGTATALADLEPAPSSFEVGDFSDRVSVTYLTIYLDDLGEVSLLGGIGDSPGVDPEITVRERGRGYLSNGSGILKFRNTRVGRKAPKKTLLVGNAGLGTLTRLGTRFTGSARRDYTAIIRGARSVSPGASRQIDVTFKPKRRGTRTATLYVTSNDPADPNFRIKVSGKAIPAPKKR